MFNIDWKECITGSKTCLLKRKIGPFKKRSRELEQTQWFDLKNLKEYQFSKLRKLLNDAYQTVPFYRLWFEKVNFDPSQFQDLSELEQLPILTKKDVLAAGYQLVSSRIPRWMTRTAHTGGTTGTPLNIVRDLRSIGNEHAFVRRQWKWAGIEIQDRCAYLTGRVIAPPDQKKGRLFRYDPIMKELILSTYHLSNQVIDQYVSAMRDYQVKALVAYPSSAVTLAKGCIERKITLPLKAVLTSSETLLPEIRAIISEAFDCPVYDFYGSAERVCYIFTCEKGSYHVIPEYGFTEFIPTETQNIFKIVSTGFWNKAMPLIRYQLGDYVEVTGKTCSCGRHFPVVDLVVGRPQEFIVTSDGRKLGSALLTHLLYGVENIQESQLVQDAPDHCIFKYVKSAHFGNEDIIKLEKLIKMHLPCDLKIELQAVDVIERTQSGKFQPIVNQILS